MNKGTIDNDYIRQKFDLSKLKCLTGSHPFNGSCYFISNKKYSDTPSEKDVIMEQFLSIYKKKKLKKTSSQSDSGLNTAIDVATLPEYTVWKQAVNYCEQLNNDSTLLHFSNENQEEFDYIIDLLMKLNFPEATPETSNIYQRSYKKSFFVQEQKYFIGLTFNSNLFFYNKIQSSSY